MDFKIFLSLLKNNEINLLKSTLISFPCIYFVAYLYFPYFIEFNLFSSTMITIGISTIMTMLFYFESVFLNKYNDSETYGFTLTLSIFTSLSAIILGIFCGFQLHTLYLLFIAISLSFLISIISFFFRRKKTKQHKI